MLIAGRYSIIRELGRGGFGVTYQVKDTKLPGHPDRVLKQLLIPPNQPPQIQEKIKEYFEREAENLGKLGNNDRIPNVFDYFQENSQFYLVQEFIDGETLEKELRGKRLNETQVISLLRDILEVVAVVHYYQVIHRDIKPPNLIRRRRDGKLVLIDFGAVKEVQTILGNNPNLNTNISVIGTPGYMPFEQQGGHPKRCSDVYAVGIVAIQALTGIPPHLLQPHPDTLEIVWRDSVQVSDEFATILERMVRYNFSERYPSAQQALEAVEALATSRNRRQQQQYSPPPKPSPQPPSPKTLILPQPGIFSRRQLLQVAGFGGAGFMVAILGQWLLNGSDSVETPVNAPGESVETTSSPVIEPVESPEPSPPANTNNNLQSSPFEVVTVNDRGEVIERENKEAEFFEENLGNEVTMAMVAIPGGTFVMGSPESEEGYRDNESPQHSVTVPPFYMGRYPVTQAQWQTIMENNPARFKGNNRPTEKVSWDHAVEFGRKLSEVTGREYRLPSEAEWEYACRAMPSPPTPLPQGEGRIYPPFHFGATITTDLVNYDGDYTYANAPEGLDRGETTPVGSFPPNGFGLYDMHGNVWEWCLDSLHGNYNGAPTDGSAWIDNSNDSRILRGGSWNTNPRSCRVANRSANWRNNDYDSYGFRIVCVVSRTS